MVRVGIGGIIRLDPRRLLSIFLLESRVRQWNMTGRELRGILYSLGELR
jgi:hypothetical protein